jgi:hypothetical protein
MRLLLFYILLLSFQQVFSQSRDETQVRKVLNDQVQAWNNGNIESFMDGYWKSDSLMFIGKSGVTYGWKNTLANYKKNYPDTATMGKLSFTLLNVKKLSVEYFQVVGKWFLKRSVGDIGGHYSLLFRKIKNKWVIIADHTS